MSRKEIEMKIRELEKKISDLKARWPKHSVPTSMAIELEELEEKLNRLKEELSSSTEPEDS